MSDDVILPEKVLQYEKFVDEVLKEDLKKVLDQRDSVHGNIAEYLQLKNTIEMIQETNDGKAMTTKVDLGCNFYCQAKIQDTSMICIQVGLGFFVELTLCEALRFIDKKTEQLTAVSDRLSHDAAAIKARIKFVLEGLREVQGIPDTKPQPNRTDLW